MAITYTPTPTGTAPASYTIPTDGDAPRMVTGLQPPLEAVMDLAAGLAANMIPSTNFSRVQAFNPQFFDSSHIFAVAGSHVQQLTTGGGFIIELDLPNNVSLTAISLHLIGAVGHGATLTGVTKPTLAFSKVDIYTGTVTPLLGPTPDPQTTNTGYEQIHVIPLTSAGITISRGTLRYFLIVTGEAGASFLAGLRYYGVNCDFTATTRDPAAA